MGVSACQPLAAPCHIRVGLWRHHATSAVLSLVFVVPWSFGNTMPPSTCHLGWPLASLCRPRVCSVWRPLASTCPCRHQVIRYPPFGGRWRQGVLRSGLRACGDQRCGRLSAQDFLACLSPIGLDFARVESSVADGSLLVEGSHTA